MYCRTNSGDGTLVHNGAADASVADSFTAGVSASAIDQRTTIKLWKLK
jgi:hypothetical protein